MVGRCRAVPADKWSGRLLSSGAGRSGECTYLFGGLNFERQASTSLLEEESSWTKIERVSRGYLESYRRLGLGST